MRISRLSMTPEKKLNLLVDGVVETPMTSPTYRSPTPDRADAARQTNDLDVPGPWTSEDAACTTTPLPGPAVATGQIAAYPATAVVR